MPIRVVTVLFGYLPFSAISPHRMMLNDVRRFRRKEYDDLAHRACTSEST